MNMRQAMRPAYAKCIAPQAKHVRTDGLTNVVTYVGDKSCVGNARENRAQIARIAVQFGPQPTNTHIPVRPYPRLCTGQLSPENDHRTETR